jgi:hypothetical protein
VNSPSFSFGHRCGFHANAKKNWLPHVERAALYFKLKRPEDGTREKQTVDRITEEERQKKTKSPVISPQLPSR